MLSVSCAMAFTNSVVRSLEGLNGSAQYFADLLAMWFVFLSPLDVTVCATASLSVFFFKREEGRGEARWRRSCGNDLPRGQDRRDVTFEHHNENSLKILRTS